MEKQKALPKQGSPLVLTEVAGARFVSRYDPTRICETCGIRAKPDRCIAGLSGTAIGAKVLSKKQVVKISKKQANKVFDQRSQAPPNFYLRQALVPESPGPVQQRAVCNSGDHAISGGFDLAGDPTLTPDPAVIQDTPFHYDTHIPVSPRVVDSWQLGLDFARGDEVVYAVCLSGGGATFNQPANQP